MNGVFYALPKWDEVNGAPGAIEGTEPHEIDRLFFARCRMEPAWRSVDFTVDISDVYERKQAAIAACASVFQGDQARLVERWHPQKTNATAVSWACAMRNHSRREVRYWSAIPPRSRKYRSGDHGDPSSAPNPFLSVWLIQVGAGGPKSWTGSSSSAFLPSGAAAGMAPPRLGVPT